MKDCVPISFLTYFICTIYNIYVYRFKIDFTSASNTHFNVFGLNLCKLFSTAVIFNSLHIYFTGQQNVVEFLHCTPVGSKRGSYMPNMAVPDFNKI